jgi:hypothetical protein
MKILVIGIGVAASIYSLSASAYEIGTHEKLSTRAAAISILAEQNFLNDLGLAFSITDKGQLFPGSDGRERAIDQLIQDGANFEDNNTRPLNHFFDPKSGFGLAIPNARPSPDWALEDKGDVTDVAGTAQDFSYKEARQYFLDALTKTTEHRSIQYQEILHERT